MASADERSSPPHAPHAPGVPSSPMPTPVAVPPASPADHPIPSTPIMVEASHLNIPGISDLAEIGRGGFGVVYRAHEDELGRTVAVKVLPENLDETSRSRFDRERRAMGTLSGHPHIVTVYRSGYSDENVPYIVMEFLQAGSTADLLRQHGPMPWRRALEATVQLCGSVETAHRAGVLHRDIKPGNVLMSRHHEPKLADFGIARLQGQPETRSGSVTASVAHAAPEVLDGHRAHPGTDVYSLASTIYELVAGAPAFTRPTDESIIPLIARIAREPLPTLTDETLPTPVFSVLSRAMAKDPSERHQTAAELGRDLAEAQVRMGLTQTPMLIEGEAKVAPAANRPRPLSALTPPNTPPPATLPATPPQFQQHQPQHSAPVPVVQSFAPQGAPPPLAPSASPNAPASNNKTRSLVLGAVAILAFIGVAAGIGIALSNRGDERAGDDRITLADDLEDNDDGRPTDDSQTDSDDTTGDDSSDTDDSTDDDGPSDGGGPTDVRGASEALLSDIESLVDYSQYESRTDGSGAITLNVPVEWDEVDSGTDNEGFPFYQASPELDGFRGQLTSGGVTVFTIDERIDPNVVLDGVSEGGCNADNAVDGDFSPETYDGMQRLYAGCDEPQTVILHAAFSDPDPAEDWTVLLIIQMVNELDVSASATLATSLRIDGDAI